MLNVILLQLMSVLYGQASVQKVDHSNDWIFCGQADGLTDNVKTIWRELKPPEQQYFLR
jgi:hypothetical protein